MPRLSRANDRQASGGNDMTAQAQQPAAASRTALEERLRRVLAVHFDPSGGSAYWLERAAALGIDPLGDVKTMNDLSCFGEMTPADLRPRPLTDYVPRCLHGRLDEFVVGQTGGTTGVGVWSAYRFDEFEEAFVSPFVAAASHVGFPRGVPWLFVGPSGPHIIAKAARRLAQSMGSPDPFSVDFDSRWAKVLPAGSFAQQRYLAHLTEQAVQVIAAQDIGVIFATPAVLRPLADAMTATQRERIRGVHYGGMALRSDDLKAFQADLFPDAVHLSGYGNTLFGCCLELNVRPGRDLDYFPFGPRLWLEVVDEDGVALPPGHTGTVRFTRLDESMLIVRMRERDEATLVPAPADAPAGFGLPGVRNPSVPTTQVAGTAVGLY